jgi:hypothetical protein
VIVSERSGDADALPATTPPSGPTDRNLPFQHRSAAIRRQAIDSSTVEAYDSGRATAREADVADAESLEE